MASSFNPVVSLWDMVRSLTGGSFAAVGNHSQASDKFHRACADEEGDEIHIRGSFSEVLFQSLNGIGRFAGELELDATLERVITCEDC